MALNPKPFDPNEKIRKRSYLGKSTGAVLTSVDINQEKEAHVTAIEKLSDRVGAHTVNALHVVTSLVLNDLSYSNPALAELQYNITLKGTLPSNKFYVYHKGVRFLVPSTNFTAATGVITSVLPARPNIAFWLVAERTTITFGIDPVMGGVNGTGFPGPMMSSDAEVWRNESLVMIQNDTFPALAAGYEYVCKVASIGYEYVQNLVTTPTTGYVPYLLRDAPELTALSADFEQSQTKGNSGNNLFGSVARLWLKIREFQGQITKLFANTTSLFTSVGWLYAQGGHVKNFGGGAVTLPDHTNTNYPKVTVLLSGQTAVLPNMSAYTTGMATSPRLSHTIYNSGAAGTTVSPNAGQNIYGEPGALYIGPGETVTLCLDQSQGFSNSWVVTQRSNGVIPGTVIPYAGYQNPVPAGYLYCDGSAISRTTYARLFAAIDIIYGPGNGTTTFNLPDLRGEFIRGFDHGRGVDPSRLIGTSQAASAVGEHGITPGNKQPVVNGDGTQSVTETNYEYTLGTSSASNTYNKVRPRNVAMNYLIKY